MKPVFSGRWSALAVIVALALMAALPALLAIHGPPPRRQAYECLSWRFGAMPWMQEKIFDEAGRDVDIAFLGSSMIWNGVNANYVGQKLTEQRRRPAEVFMLGWNWGGYDETYFIAKDLLEHRRCRMLVIYDDRQGGSDQHRAMYRMYRYGDNAEAIRALPVRDQAALYAGAILGAPRQLISRLRPNRAEAPARWPDNPLMAGYGTVDLRGQCGSLRIPRFQDRATPFVAERPRSTATAGDVLIYSAATADRFEQCATPREDYQRHFIAALVKLCREHGTRLVMVHVPLPRDPASERVTMEFDWSAAKGPPCDLVGIPYARLFGGLTPAAVDRLFYDVRHLNQNGQDHFTRLITPALLELYGTPLSP